MVRPVYAFRERLELDPARLELVEHGYDVAQASPQAVELPHGKGVAWLESLEAAEQGRALRHARPGDPVIGKLLCGSGLLQSRELQAGVLVVRGYARIAVFPSFILGQSFGTRKPAFLAAPQIVPKLTLIETAGEFDRSFRNVLRMLTIDKPTRC
jgi:hypothetical protein